MCGTRKRKGKEITSNIKVEPKRLEVKLQEAELQRKRKRKTEAEKNIRNRCVDASNSRKTFKYERTSLKIWKNTQLVGTDKNLVLQCQAQVFGGISRAKQISKCKYKCFTFLTNYVDLRGQRQVYEDNSNRWKFYLRDSFSWTNFLELFQTFVGEIRLRPQSNRFFPEIHREPNILLMRKHCKSVKLNLKFHVIVTFNINTLILILSI